ncbi:MAG: insulinase family protein [Dehalococcoidia bacterium]
MPLMPPRPLTRRRLLALGAAVAGGALLPVTPRRAGAEGAEGAVIRATLDNGRVVLIEERPVADTVALRLTARVGVRDDGERPGIAALAQRSLLQGTTRRPTATDLLRVAAEVGSTLNRSLTAEASAVACVMQSGRLAIALDLLADIVGAPRFDPDAVRRQQGLLAGELAARKVNPPALMTDLFDRTLFAGHPLAAGSLITEDDVWALTNDDLAAHHDPRLRRRQPGPGHRRAGQGGRRTHRGTTLLWRTTGRGHAGAHPPAATARGRPPHGARHGGPGADDLPARLRGAEQH